MQKKSKKSVDLEIERSEKRKSPGGLSIKEGRHIFQRIDDYYDARAEIHRRNPHKTDYVLPTGKMLSVPAKLLASEKDVIGMYKHLREFCANNVTHDPGIIYRDHNNPVDCLIYMYDSECIALEEMRAILQIPLQIRQLHEHLYRLELLEVFPYRQFVVEFVELLRFMLRLHGLPSPKTIRRYCYSWSMVMPKPANLPHAEDVIANSYEQRLIQNKQFLGEWEELRAAVPVSKWSYTRYQDWFVAFDASSDFNPDMARKADRDWACPQFAANDVSKPSTLKGALWSFCMRWALTHIGTPLAGDIAIGHVIFRAERVNVYPMREDDRPAPNVLNPIGHDVRVPKYYAFSHIQEYYDRDFSQLKYAMELTENQRKVKYELSNPLKIQLLRSLKVILKRNKMTLPDIYRIQKSITGMTQGSLHKIGFARPRYMPAKALEKGRVKNMGHDELFKDILSATAHNKSDQRDIYRILRHFGINVDFLSVAV